MLIVRASSWCNHPVNLFPVCRFSLLCTIFFLRLFKKKIFFFSILHFSQRNLKSQVQSGFWNQIQQLSGFLMHWDMHFIWSRTKEGQAGKRPWRAAERYPPYSQHPSKPARCALAEAREWLQRSLRARNWAMTFVLRLLSSQDLKGKQSCRKTRKTASLCHKNLYWYHPRRDQRTWLLYSSFFSLCLMTMTHPRDLWSRGLSSLLSSNPTLDGWSWWHDTW